MKNTICISMVVLVLLFFSCENEEVLGPGRSDTNTVTLLSTLGKWSSGAPMITDSEGYLYTLLQPKQDYSANLEDEFPVFRQALVKTNNRGEIIWKVASPELLSNKKLAIDEENNIYITTENGWFKVQANGYTESIKNSEAERVPREVIWTSRGDIVNKDRSSFISNNGTLSSYNYETEELEWSKNTGVGGAFIDTDMEGNIFIASGFEVYKFSSQGDLLSTFTIPQEYESERIKGLKVFDRAFYLIIDGTYEIVDNRLISYNDGFRNIFINEPYIAKYSSISGAREWIQRPDLAYSQIEDEFIGDLYLEVLAPSCTISNLIQDQNGNMWFNLLNYQKQDIGNTIGVKMTFGGYTSISDVTNNTVPASLVSVKP